MVVKATSGPLALVFLLVVLPVADAHANYVSSDPARSARLQTAPAQIVVVLSESIDVSGSGLELRDHQGRGIALSNQRAEGGQDPRLSAEVPPLSDGAYTVTWRALSDVDGHVTTGRFGFALGAFEPPEIGGEAFQWDFLSSLIRLLQYAGFALAAGGVAFLAWVEPRPVSLARARALATVTAWGAGLAFVVAILLLARTQETAGSSWTGFLAEGRVGRDLGWRVVALAGLLVAALAARASRDPSKVLLLGAAPFLLVAAWLAGRFAHSSQNGAVAVAVDAAHLVAAAAWIGALALLLLSLRRSLRERDEARGREAGRRFSRVALPAVAVVGLSGLVSSVLVLGTGALWKPLSLLASPYGAVLAAKVTLFAMMLGFASLNRLFYLGPERSASKAPSRRRGLARAVAAEATLGVIVLALAGILTAISPPSANDAGRANEFSITGSGSDYDVEMSGPTPREGQAENFSIRIWEGGSGERVTSAQRVALALASRDRPEAGVERWQANATSAGEWAFGPVLFSEAGSYTVEVSIQTDEVYLDTVRLDFVVERANA